MVIGRLQRFYRVSHVCKIHFHVLITEPRLVGIADPVVAQGINDKIGVNTSVTHAPHQFLAHELFDDRFNIRRRNTDRFCKIGYRNRFFIRRDQKILPENIVLHKVHRFHVRPARSAVADFQKLGHIGLLCIRFHLFHSLLHLFPSVIKTAFDGSGRNPKRCSDIGNRFPAEIVPHRDDAVLLGQKRNTPSDSLCLLRAQKCIVYLRVIGNVEIFPDGHRDRAVFAPQTVMPPPPQYRKQPRPQIVDLTAARKV